MIKKDYINISKDTSLIFFILFLREHTFKLLFILSVELYATKKGDTRQTKKGKRRDR